MSEQPISEVVTDAAAAAKAQFIRDSATKFVEMMAEALVTGGHCADIHAAYREVAIQATFNATVIYEALPEGMQKIFADKLRGSRG